MDREEAKIQSELVTGVSNVAYDLEVVLSNHLQAIAALQEYKIDAREAQDDEASTALERIEAQYEEGIGELRRLLQSRL